MNLDRLTKKQRMSVMRVTGPLLISAGAGSGKTFTLTQRIAYALLNTSASGVSDVDEILAITFTEKAAAEIKARVKSTLREEGLSDQALKIDASWISTIHGMCSRILRAHALEIGIDPGFGVIGEMEAADLIAESINEALGQENEIISNDAFEKLFSEYPARSTFAGTSSISSMLQTLISEAANLKQGLDGITLGPSPRNISSILKDMLCAYEEVLPVLEQAGESKAAVTARQRVDEAIEVLGKAILEDVDVSADDAAALVDGCYFIPCTFGNAEVKQAIREYQAIHSMCANELLLNLARPFLDELMGLAKTVQERYEQKKRDRFVLDNNDLLIKTLKAFDDYPAIAKGYADQFKMVMVDEFQDTSQTQIDIIEYLAGSHFSHLCTVGDSQQSIYRFRGADVNVYEAHKTTMCSPEVGAWSIELSQNFRSHRDVLSFVDRIFEQSHVFGEKFMSLTPHLERASSYQAKTPRIDVQLAMRPAGNNTGVGIQDAKRTEAEGIAQKFAAYREAGHKAGDMVILLGKMTYAEIYAQALRDKDFECVISGGSLFDKASEVHVVARLAEVLANTSHTAALFEVLTSDMFRLCADDLIELSTVRDEETGVFKRVNLGVGLKEVAAAIEEDPQVVPLRLRHAVRVLQNAQSEIGLTPMAGVLKDVLLDSGWIHRLEMQGAFGIAQAGNIFKALRIIESLEKENGYGVARIAQAFSSQLDFGLKEAPGALTGGSDSVVKIMTIHSSKGLEFPLVAVADFYGLRSNTDKLLIETCNGTTYASLSLGESTQRYPELQKRAKTTVLVDEENSLAFSEKVEKANTPAELRMALRAYADFEELAEVRRKFYVGLTRASEALVVSMSAKISTKDPLSAYKDVVDDVRSALFGHEDFPEGNDLVAYGGTEPALFERVGVTLATTAEDDITHFSEDDTAEFTIPVFTPREELNYSTDNSLREGLFSYSSLAASKGLDDAADKTEDMLVEEQRHFSRVDDAEKATNLGTAFHRIAQYAVETNTLPSSEKVSSVSGCQGLTSGQERRLESALDAWFASELHASTKTFDLRRAELSFCVTVDDEWLEGEIDLFCSNGIEEPVLIVDYKTGGSLDETDDELYQKHLLQAQCYAFATLKQGYRQVDIAFVRVEQASDDGQPQIVRYSFVQDDIKKLRRVILDIRQNFKLI